MIKIKTKTRQNKYEDQDKTRQNNDKNEDKDADKIYLLDENRVDCDVIHALTGV
jgi:hypothetical protein